MKLGRLVEGHVLKKALHDGIHRSHDLDLEFALFEDKSTESDLYAAC